MYGNIIKERQNNYFSKLLRYNGPKRVPCDRIKNMDKIVQGKLNAVLIKYIVNTIAVKRFEHYFLQVTQFI